MNVPNKTKGFTIIEVVLVLAIAGLIFLVVFLALPALQRSQRDNQRKSDLGRMMSQVTAYQSNNQGVLPTSWDTTFKSNYMTNGGQTWNDPQTGNAYKITTPSTIGGTAPTLSAGDVYVYTQAQCGGGSWGVSSNTNSRSFAAIMYQEQGGFTCESN